MVNKDKQIAQFIDAINKNAIKECKRIEKATKKLYTGEAEKLEKSAKAQMQDKIAYAKAELETEFNKNLALSYSDCRKKLAEKRNELTKNVFAKTEDKLAEFTKSDRYKEFLENSLKEIYGYVGSTLNAFVRQCDVDLVSEAAESAGVPCRINGDNAIRLGGVRVECEEMNKIFDDTLDSRLEDQKKWFFENSGFKISQ